MLVSGLQLNLLYCIRASMFGYSSASCHHCYEPMKVSGHKLHSQWHQHRSNRSYRLCSSNGSSRWPMLVSGLQLNLLYCIRASRFGYSSASCLHCYEPKKVSDHKLHFQRHQHRSSHSYHHYSSDGSSRWPKLVSGLRPSLL